MPAANAMDASCLHVKSLNAGDDGWNDGFMVVREFNSSADWFTDGHAH